MKRPIAYITAPWGKDDIENTELAAAYCRKVYEAGFSPVCPLLFLPLFLHEDIPAEHIQRNVSTVMKNRLYGRLGKKGTINEVYLRKQYGKSKQIRFVSSKTVCPVGFIKTKNPMFKKKAVCKYTVEGRAEIHKGLKINTHIMLALMRVKEQRRSIEYMDNRISLYAAQHGKCAITGAELGLDEIHCHHKKPSSVGGTDTYKNLIIVHREVHKLIHATQPDTINACLNLIRPDKKALTKINELRVLAGTEEI